MESLYKFLVELDKLKNVYRRSYLSNTSRNENSAEHSWHLAIALLTLKDEFNLKIDILKALKLALVHDICEIDSGDISVYAEGWSNKATAERACVHRIADYEPKFASEILKLWDEYETQESTESHWVKIIDRLLPFMMNMATEGKSWKEQGVSKKQVININQIVKQQAPEIFEWMVTQMDEAVKKGWLIDQE